jgi:hypothetical protein
MPPSRAQRDLNTALRLAYFENKPTGLLGGSPKKASERSLTPFGPGASTSQINLVLLYAFPLYAVRKEVGLHRWADCFARSELVSSVLPGLRFATRLVTAMRDAPGRGAPALVGGATV